MKSEEARIALDKYPAPWRVHFEMGQGITMRAANGANITHYWCAMELEAAELIVAAVNKFAEGELLTGASGREAGE